MGYLVILIYLFENAAMNLSASTIFSKKMLKSLNQIPANNSAPKVGSKYEKIGVNVKLS